MKVEYPKKPSNQQTKTNKEVKDRTEVFLNGSHLALVRSMVVVASISNETTLHYTPLHYGWGGGAVNLNGFLRK